MDFLVGTVMFFTALFVFYGYYSNSASSSTGSIDHMRRDAQSVSSFLMSEGFPINWNSTSVERIGIVDSGFRLNSSKLDSLTNVDYEVAKNLFNTKYDYYFYFSDNLNGIANISSFGKPGVNVSSLETQENPDKVVSLSRFVFYDNHIYRMVVYLWE